MEFTTDETQCGAVMKNVPLSMFIYKQELVSCNT